MSLIRAPAIEAEETGASRRVPPLHHAFFSRTSPASPPAWLYGLVVFVAAWLVFWVQPLAVRDVLPVLGGSPAVWNTAMVFFQAALLAGSRPCRAVRH